MAFRPIEVLLVWVSVATCRSGSGMDNMCKYDLHNTEGDVTRVLYFYTQNTLEETHAKIIMLYVHNRVDKIPWFGFIIVRYHERTTIPLSSYAYALWCAKNLWKHRPPLKIAELPQQFIIMQLCDASTYSFRMHLWPQPGPTSVLSPTTWWHK